MRKCPKHKDSRGEKEPKYSKCEYFELKKPIDKRELDMYYCGHEENMESECEYASCPLSYSINTFKDSEGKTEKKESTVEFDDTLNEEKQLHDFGFEISDSEGEKEDSARHIQPQNEVKPAGNQSENSKLSEPSKFDLRELIQIAYDLAQPKKEPCPQCSKLITEIANDLRDWVNQKVNAIDLISKWDGRRNLNDLSKI